MAELSINDVNPLLPAADMHNVAGSGTSVFQEVDEFFTKMLPAATVSGLYGVLNTPIEVANWLGADLKPFDTEDTLRAFDDDLGLYYQEHKDSADMLGFIGSSVISGIGAVKAIKLAQAGKMGKGMAFAYNLAPQAKEKALSAAIAKIGEDGTTVFSGVASHKLQALALGVADNLLMSLTMETVAASVAAASPVFDGKELSDVLWTIGYGTVFGGAIGGTLDGIILNSQFRKGIKALEAGKRPLEAVEAPSLSQLAEGDRVALIVDSVLDLPEELATTNALRQTFDATVRRSRDKSVIMLNEMAGGDATVGNKLADLVYEIRDKALADGMSVEATKEKLGDFLQQAKTIRRLGDADALDLLDPKRYLYTPKEFPELTPETTMQDLLKSLFPRQRPDEVASAWLMKKPLAEVKIGMTAPTMDSTVGFVAGARKGWFLAEDDAFDAGADIFINMRTKKVKVNPGSADSLRTPTTTGEVILNLKTGQVVLQAQRTVGDIAQTADTVYLTKGGTELAVSYSQKEAGSKILRPVIETFDQKVPLDWTKATTLDASARYVWAAKLPGEEMLGKVGTQIQATDFPVLERLLADDTLLSTAKGLKMKIIVPDETGLVQTVVPIETIAPTKGALEEFIKEQKLAVNKLIQKADPTLTNYLAAQRLNASQEFLETGTGVAFKDPTDFLTPSHAVIKYETEATSVDGMFVRGLLGLKQRQFIAQQRQIQAFTAVAGSRAEAFMNLDGDTVRARASQTGSGAGYLTSSSPEFGDVVGQAAQLSGKEAKLWEEAEYAASESAFADIAQAIWQKPEVATEISMITEALRRTATQYKLTANGDIVAKGLVDAQESLARAVSPTAIAAARDKIEQITEDLASRGVKPTLTPKFAETVDFFQRHIDRNTYRVEKQNLLRAAMGSHYTDDPNVLYVPPIDTARYNFHALVREKGQTVGATNKVGFIVAKNEAELQSLAAKVDATKFEVLFKKADTEGYHKALGDAKYELSLSQGKVNSMLEKEGLLYKFFPATEPDAVLKEYFDWHFAQDKRLVTSAIEVRYADAFAELRELGKQYTAVGTSRFKGIGDKVKVENPFEDYIRLATNVSKKQNYTLWMEANEFTESLGRKAFDATKAAFTKAKEGSITWEAANKLAEEHGIVAPFKASYLMQEFNALPDRQVATELVNKANMTLATTTLRLDFLNSLVNTISSPISMGGELSHIRRIVANDPEMAGVLRELMEVAIPGTNGAKGVPSTTKLISRSIQNYFGPEAKTLIEAYKQRGFIMTQLEQHHGMLDTLAVRGGQPISKFREAVEKGVEMGAKITLNEQAEQFTRFVAADIMRQLTDPLVAAGKMEKGLQNAYMTTFVNRVQGNYIASQRPAIFQGVIGQAIGLFQTYQFNMLQNLFRYIGNGDKKTAAIMMGLQGTIYGMQGVPFFDAANRVLIGNNAMNPYHKDAYSAVPEMVGKELGEWILYGTASAFPLFSDQAPALYSRGDINPRHWSIVPLLPTDLPAVSASIKVATNMWDMAKKLGGGAAPVSALLEGLEHNGVSRPLAGLAQVAQGYATTSKGSLISSSIDYDSIANYTRILGAKPANEAIALDGMYRKTAYQAKDRDRMEDLGEIAKSKLRAGGHIDDQGMQDLMLKYASSGGNIKQFNASLVRWYKNANQSQINTLRNQMGSEYSKRMMELMGGEEGAPLQDFMNTPPVPKEPEG